MNGKMNQVIDRALWDRQYDKSMYNLPLSTLRSTGSCCFHPWSCFSFSKSDTKIHFLNKCQHLTDTTNKLLSIVKTQNTENLKYCFMCHQ